MSRVYKSAVLVRTASVTTADGVRLDLKHWRYTTDSAKAAVAHREWVTHAQYVGERQVRHLSQCFTGRNLDTLDREWQESVDAMWEAGEVTLEQHSNDPKGSRWLSKRDRHDPAPPAPAAQPAPTTAPRGESTVSTATPAQGIDWSRMSRTDFDPSAPLALVDDRSLTRRVEAVPDAYGTDALFGDAPTARRPVRARKAPAAAPQVDSLF